MPDALRPTRRTVLAGATLGAGLLTFPALVERALAGAPAIAKPLPPQWFVDYGTNAEMRWDSVDPRRYLDLRCAASLRSAWHLAGKPASA